MPLQNRVDPFGNIVATPARGAWLGNRGLLHDAQQRIRRPFRLKAWLICVLQFKNRRRVVMSPGLYTELFFLDEATALAAGHRPCCECRRADYHRFKAAAERGTGRAFPRARDLDEALHAERWDGVGKPVAMARPADLPDGAMLAIDGRAHLKWRGVLYPWAAEGYGAPVAIPAGAARVLTPATTLAAIRAGYVPQVAIEPATPGAAAAR